MALWFLRKRFLLNFFNIVKILINHIVLGNRDVNFFEDVINSCSVPEEFLFL